MIKLFELLSVERIQILDVLDKNSVLIRLVNIISKSDFIHDPIELEGHFFKREKILSTSIVGLVLLFPM